ncbi:hypothetical protein HerbRD11066_05440 [Herbidospora sp. RD11066]
MLSKRHLPVRLRVPVFVARASYVLSPEMTRDGVKRERVVGAGYGVPPETAGGAGVGGAVTDKKKRTIGGAGRGGSFGGR